MTIFLIILAAYALWCLLGYLGFRMIYRITNGYCVINDYGPRSPMTPRTGLLYMLVFGAVAFIIGLGWTIVNLIINTWNNMFKGGIDRSLGANRFFGIK